MPISSDRRDLAPVIVTGRVERVDDLTTAANHVRDQRARLASVLKEFEDRLNAVGDDAQLANVDLQSVLEIQQRTLQMMSALSQTVNDTVLSIVRKISG